MAQTIAGINIAFGAETATLVSGLNKATQAVNNATNQITNSFQRMQTAAQRAQQVIIGATAGFVSLQMAQRAAKAVMDYSDAWQEATNKVRASEAISGTQARSLHQIAEMAKEVRAPLADLTDLYSKMLRVSNQVGASELQVAQATETVAKAFKAGGASTLEQVNGIRQLAQALGSGILQGDELRSIRENAPLIAQAIADEFKTTIAGLKALGAEGKLESDRVFKAILNSKQQIDTAFGATTSTISDAFTNLETSTIEVIARFNEATGASKIFAAGINGVANNMQEVIDNSIVGTLVETKRAMDNYYGLLPQVNVEHKGIVSTLLEMVGIDSEGFWNKVTKAVKLALNPIASVNKALRAVNEALKEQAALNVAGSSMGANFGAAQAEARAAREQRAAEALAEKLPKGGQSFTKKTQLLMKSHVEAYKENLEAIKDAESDWAANVDVVTTPAGERLASFWNSIPGLVEQTMTPMEQYREQLRLISLSEVQLAEAGVSAAQLRQQAVLGLAETALGAAGAMSGALAALFKENKAFAIANVVIHTAEAIVSALKNPPGPPFSYVYAAAAAVTGAAQLAAIMSAKPGGGKITGVKGGAGSKKASAGESAVAAGGASAGLQQSIVLQIKGDIFGPDHFRKIVEGINGVQRDGTALIRLG